VSFSKFPSGIENTGISGVVIAGYGDDDIFPSLIAYKIEGLINGKLKYKLDIEQKIDFNTEAIIIPFAQKEMVQTFMEGVHPEYISIEIEYLKKVFDQFIEIIAENTDKSKNLKKAARSILRDFRKNLEKYRKEKYIDPIMNIVSKLPKDELASMAEALINLTSLKRRWSIERETVGGPIDVAVISKGDGFIWIKRKHYFKAELNPQFFEKYFMEVKE